MKPGSIILLHDRVPNTVEILEELFLYLKENGYKVSQLDKLLGIEAYE